MQKTPTYLKLLYVTRHRLEKAIGKGHRSEIGSGLGGQSETPPPKNRMSCRESTEKNSCDNAKVSQFLTLKKQVTWKKRSRILQLSLNSP